MWWWGPAAHLYWLGRIQAQLFSAQRLFGFQTWDDRFHRCAARRLIHDRIPIFVTTILPGGINTPFFDKSLTRLGGKPRPSPPVYEPKLVADAILYAAEHPVREMYVGGAGRSMAWMHRLSPGLTDRLFSRFGYRPQLTDQPPNNLYQHVEGDNQVQGTFGKEARSVSLYTGLRMNLKLFWGLLIGLGSAGYALLSRRKTLRR